MERVALDALVGQPLIIILQAIVIWVLWRERQRRDEDQKATRAEDRQLLRETFVVMTRATEIMRLLAKDRGVVVDPTSMGETSIGAD